MSESSAGRRSRKKTIKLEFRGSPTSSSARGLLLNFSLARLPMPQLSSTHKNLIKIFRLGGFCSFLRGVDTPGARCCLLAANATDERVRAAATGMESYSINVFLNRRFHHCLSFPGPPLARECLIWDVGS
jgi:hypothetical protein